MELNLKMNTGNTEFIYFGNKPELAKCTFSSINVCADQIQMSEVVRYLGAFFYNSLTFKEHNLSRINVQQQCSNQLRSDKSGNI